MSAQKIDINQAGHYYVTGYFYGTVAFGTGPDTTTLTSAGSSDIFVAKFVETLPVAIDIWFGRFPNVINLKSRTIPVTLFSTVDFDVTVDLDKESLTFGGSGDEDSLQRRGQDNVPSCQERDMNKDGLLDLQCHFHTAASGFQVEDTEGILKGQTIAGTLIVGHDSVQVVSGDR